MTTTLATPTSTHLSLLEERDALVDALIAAQDRLGAMAAMLGVLDGTFDLDVLTRRMLAEALELTSSDAVVLSCAHGRPHQRLAAPGVVDGTRLQRLADDRLRRLQPGCGRDDGMPWAQVTFPSFPDVGICVVRTRGAEYTTGDVRMLDTVALAVQQLSRLSRLHEELVRQSVVEQEHQLASRLAQSVLPVGQPSFPGIDVFARCTPAALAGGDFMVFTEVDDLVWFAVGDVAGKGLPAAMVMTQAVSALRVAMRTGDPEDPAAALRTAGRDLRSYLESAESFLTLVVGAHRLGSATVTLSNAGHSPVVHRPRPGASATMVRPGSPPLGVDGGREPSTTRWALPPGARLVIGTDGLVEQPDPSGTMLGYDSFVRECGRDARSAGDLGERLLQQVEAHAAGEPAADDRTLVVLEGSGDHRA